jgi:PAS domain S-box-containing protein
MIQTEYGIERRQALRRGAEALISPISNPGATALPTEALVHELLVHKVELEMQNEELRLAQAALEEARDRYLNLYEFSPQGYITVNRDGMVQEVNMTGAAMLGIDRSQLISCRFGKLVAPQDKDRWHRLFMNTMEHAGIGKKTFYLNMVRADGSTFHAHLDCLRLDPDGESAMLRLALVDISKIKLAEKELRLAAMVFESQQGMMITDVNGAILRTNRALSNSTGYSEEELVGRNPRLFQSGLHDAKFYIAMWASISRFGSWEGEIWNKRKNGKVSPEYLAISAIKDEDGIPTNYVATYLRHPETNTRK